MDATTVTHPKQGGWLALKDAIERQDTKLNLERCTRVLKAAGEIMARNVT